MEPKLKVLFLSTGNSSRSQIAEALLRSYVGDELVVASAAIKTAGADLLATEVMTEVGIDIRSQHPKNVAEALKEHFGYVITLYDAARERSPIFPFTPHLLQWSIADPNITNGSPAERRAAFRRVREEIRAQIQNFLGETAKPEHDHGMLAYV